MKMLRTLNFFFVIVCLSIPATFAVEGINTVLSDVEVRRAKKVVPTDQRSWVAEYNQNGKLMMPFTNLAICELKKKKIVVGGFVALSGDNGPILAQLLELAEMKNITVFPLVVIVNPNNNAKNADHRACIQLLHALKRKNVGIFKLKNPNATEEAYENWQFYFTDSLHGSGVLDALKMADLLAVGLCGVTNASESKTNVVGETNTGDKVVGITSAFGQSSATMLAALKLLPALTKGEDVVMSLNTPSGRADDGSWPFENAHTCTHLVHLFWPMEALKTEKTETRNFITSSPFVNRDPCLPKIETDVATIRKSLDNQSFAEVKYMEA